MVEALWALLLALVVSTAALLLLARQRAVQGELVRRMDYLTAVRTTRHVLGAEVRAATGGGDIDVFAPDSMRLRVFRGSAAVCGVPAWDALVVTVDGVRLPDSGKDSVLLLDVDGGVHALGLRSDAAARTGGSTCAVGQGTLRAWRLTDSIPAGVIAARYFERGSYHLGAGALRYRRGDGGRQPLTGAVLATPPSAFGASRGGAPSVDLWPARDGGSAWSLSFLPGGG